MNNSTLKTMLAGKVMNLTPKTEVASAATKVETSNHKLHAHLPESFTATLSFTMPLSDIARFLEQIKVFLPEDVTINHDASNQPASEPVRVAVPGNSMNSGRMSDKQQTMILNLIKRKKLTAEQVKALLLHKFGVTDGRLLDKKQASQLITQLLA